MGLLVPTRRFFGGSLGSLRLSHWSYHGGRARLAQGWSKKVWRPANQSHALRGHSPRSGGPVGPGTIEQFVAIAKTWDYSRVDFVCEVSTNRKAVYLNFLFWAQFDFNAQGIGVIGVQERDSTVAHLREAWE